MDPSEHERQRAFDENHALRMDGRLFRVIAEYGLTSHSEYGDPDKPYSIHLELAGHGQTTCYGATVREAAQRAFDWLRSKGAA